MLLARSSPRVQLPRGVDWDQAVGVAWPLRESVSLRESKMRMADLMATDGKDEKMKIGFVAHGYLEPSPAVPGERERYLRSRRKAPNA